MLLAIFIGFMGGVVFLASILLFFCSTASKKWIHADLEATNWDESREQIDQSRGGYVDSLHHQDACCQKCQQAS